MAKQAATRQQSGARRAPAREAFSQFPRPADAPVLAAVAVEYLERYPDELDRLIAAFNIAPADARTSDGQPIADVELLERRFSAVKPVGAERDPREAEPLAWLYSLAWWRHLQKHREGDDELSGALASLLHWQRAFFLQQRWIAELLEHWHEHDLARERAVLFGKPRKGLPTLEGAIKQWQADQRLCSEVFNLMHASGMSQRKATDDLAERSLELLGYKVSADAVREKYRKYMQQKRNADHPLVTVLCGRKSPS